MITLQLSALAARLNGQLKGADGPFTALGTDSRKSLDGQLFIALKGPNFDGHDYLQAAAQQGAVAALVERWQPVPLTQIKVDDTLRALGQLSATWRQKFTRPLIALTGSNGKTTTKNMLAAILRQCGQVLATAGNLNNDIGVPLTLARLGREDYAVLELGANHPGEIAYLTALARPDVALITNAGPAHLEGFGDLVGVARAKGEIYQGLSAQSCAVLNRDDAFAEYWQALIGARRCVDFSMQQTATCVYAQVITEQPNRFELHIGGASVDIELGLPGRHNVMNALAAAATASAVGASLVQIQAGLVGMDAVTGRLQRQPGPFGSTLIDDSYNANPSSLAVALQVLAQASGPKWLVLGDMAELGVQAQARHADAGIQAREVGVSRLFALGELSQNSVAAFGTDGEHFAQASALSEAVLTALADHQHAAPTVLIKGSRSMRMERIVQALQAVALKRSNAEAGFGPC